MALSPPILYAPRQDRARCLAPALGLEPRNCSLTASLRTNCYTGTRMDRSTGFRDAHRTSTVAPGYLVGTQRLELCFTCLSDRPFLPDRQMPRKLLAASAMGEITSVTMPTRTFRPTLGGVSTAGHPLATHCHTQNQSVTASSGVGSAEDHCSHILEEGLRHHSLVRCAVSAEWLRSRESNPRAQAYETRRLNRSPPATLMEQFTLMLRRDQWASGTRREGPLVPRPRRTLGEEPEPWQDLPKHIPAGPLSAVKGGALPDTLGLAGPNGASCGHPSAATPGPSMCWRDLLDSNQRPLGSQPNARFH